MEWSWLSPSINFTPFDGFLHTLFSLVHKSKVIFYWMNQVRVPGAGWKRILNMLRLNSELSVEFVMVQLGIEDCTCSNEKKMEPRSSITYCVDTWNHFECISNCLLPLVPCLLKVVTSYLRSCFVFLIISYPILSKKKKNSLKLWCQNVHEIKFLHKQDNFLPC